MKEWNENDWQGKRKDQVDYSGKVLFYSSIGFILLLIIGSVSTFFK
jgi:hypothetical protein